MQTDRQFAPRLMAIFAHPDDESFGMAGALARASAMGAPAAVVSATRGEAGEIADPALATPQTLGRVREWELRRACAAAGVHDVSFLDYLDGHLAEADLVEAVGRVVWQLRAFRPDVVVTFSPNGGYGHRDHMAINHLVLAAVPAAADPGQYAGQLAQGLAPHRVRKLYYNAMPRERMLALREEARAHGKDFIPGGNAATLPVEEMGTPEREITTRVTLGDAEFAAKRQAMRAHATQMPADSPFAQASPEEMRDFMGSETFQLVPPPLSDRAYPVPEADLFAGLGERM